MSSEKGAKSSSDLPWTATLATTDPTTTITPKMMVEAGNEPAAFSHRTFRETPRDALRSARLPSVDVSLAAAETVEPEGEGESPPPNDLVVRELIAEGGMGRVFLAEQRSLARDVAIKTVKDSGDSEQLDALLWEGAIAGHLDHPGVTPIHLIGTSADGHTILVMKRIQGVRWSDLIHGGDDVWGRFPALPRDRLRAHLEILMEVARTIHFAHRRGIVHLDIKPDNVMIGDLGEVYLVDWGVAQILRPNLRLPFVGTPVFAPPELVRGDEIGSFSDVYLLGAVLHYVLTREPRHPGRNLFEVLNAALASEPRTYAQDVPAELAQLANGATSLEASQRPRDALAFRTAIMAYLEHTASRELTVDGCRRLREMDGTEDSGRALRLAVEARFAFSAALERWSDNEEAKTALESCLAKTMLLEIERENLAGALEIERELNDVSAELRRRREDLERVLDERGRSAQELRVLKDDVSLERGGAERRKLVAALIALVAVGAGLSFLPLDQITGSSALFGTAPLLAGGVVLAVLAFWLRRGLLANAVGRRLVVVFFATIALLVLHRGAFFHSQLDPDAAEARNEMFLIAAMSGGVATFVARPLWLVTLAQVVGALAITLFPHLAELIFDVAAFATLVVLIVVFRRSRSTLASQVR